MTACLLVFLAGCIPPSNSDGLQVGSKEAQVTAFTELGKARLIQGDLPGALSELSKAEALNPNNIDTLTLLGLTYYRRREYDKAIDYYQKALSIEPGRSEVRNNLGLVYMDMREFDKARSEFEACLRDPTYNRPFLAQTNLGILEETLGNAEAAEAIYLKSIEISPQYATSYLRLGRINYNRGQYRQAADLLMNAIRLEGDYVEAYWVLAETYEKLKMPDEAAEAYGKVINLAPNTAMALEAQSRVRRVLGFE
jgi:type IV pilus biogenesis/stability protein PilW